MFLQDSNTIIIGFFGAAMTTISGVSSYFAIRYFKRAEKSARRRELKQEMYYEKHDASIFALAATFDKDASEKFMRNYKDRLRELESERKQLDNVAV